MTDFYYWEDSTGSHRDIACEQYHLPAHIQEHVDYATPGIRLRANNVMKRDAKKRSVDKRAITNVPGLREGPHFTNNVAYMNAVNDVPGVNSTSCSNFITADCLRGMSL